MIAKGNHFRSLALYYSAGPRLRIGCTTSAPVDGNELHGLVFSTGFQKASRACSVDGICIDNEVDVQQRDGDR
jgi:hypothetical protein